MPSTVEEITPNVAAIICDSEKNTDTDIEPIPVSENQMSLFEEQS